MPSTNKIQVYLPAEVLERLKTMAKKQNRSASNLAATFVIQCIEKEDEEQTNYDEATSLIKALASDTRPTDANIVLAAHELSIESESLFKLRDRLFKEGK
jgi:predicted DNA-binding protein